MPILALPRVGEGKSFYSPCVFTQARQIPIADIERVEVLKGPSAILSGVSTLGGGTVNLTTKQPTSTVIRDLTARYGSFGDKMLAVDLGGPLAGTEGLTYRFNLAGTLTDENYAGYRNASEYLVSPVVKWEGEGTSLLAGLRFFDQTRLPVQYTFAARNPSDFNPLHPLLRIPRGVMQVNPNLHYHDTTTTLYSEQSHDFGDILGLNVVLNNKVRYEISYDDINGYSWLGTTRRGAPAGSWQARQTMLRYDYARLIDQADLTLTYDAGFARQVSKFGIDYTSFAMNASTNYSSPFSINPLTGLPTQPLYRVPNGPATNYDGTRGTGIGYYYTEKFDTLDNRLHIFGQVRYDDLDSIARSGIGRIKPSVDYPTDGLSWTAGAAFDVTPYFTAYGNRSVGIVPQNSINSLTGKPTPPMGVDQFEFGGRFYLFDKKLTVTADYFDLAATNVAVCDAIRGCNFVELVGGQNSKGFEFEMQGEVLPGLNLIGAFSSIKAKNVSTQVASAMNAIPQYTASLWVAYTVQDGPLRGLTVGLGARGTSDSLTSASLNDPTKLKIPGYVVADAMIGYTMDRFSVQLKVNNIFNKYAYMPSYATSYVGIVQGRAFLLQAKYSFD